MVQPKKFNQLQSRSENLKKLLHLLQQSTFTQRNFIKPSPHQQKNRKNQNSTQWLRVPDQQNHLHDSFHDSRVSNLTDVRIKSHSQVSNPHLLEPTYHRNPKDQFWLPKRLFSYRIWIKIASKLNSKIYASHHKTHLQKLFRISIQHGKTRNSRTQMVFTTIEGSNRSHHTWKQQYNQQGRIVAQQERQHFLLV